MQATNAPIYSEDWKGWKDPEVPEFFNPTELLLDRHADGALAAKAALIADDVPVSYARLRDEVCRAANGLRALGAAVESRLLVFSTDSVPTIATWLAAVRSGIVPAAHRAPPVVARAAR